MDPVNDIARHRSLFIAGGEGDGKILVVIPLIPRQVFVVF